MEIKTVAIVGAGAMGAAYAAMFTDAEGFSVSFAARGERLRRLRQVPLTVNGKTYHIPTVDPETVAEPADLVLVALKHHHLAAALDDIKRLTGRNTVILSVMNGLESEEMIGAVCGMEQVVYAIAVGIDAVRDGGCFTYGSRGKIIFGPGPGAAAGAGRRVERLRQALERAGVPNEVSADIMQAMWWKFMINVGINQASAVLRAPYRLLQTSADAAALMNLLMKEVIVLAQKAEIDLKQKHLDEWNAIFRTLSPEGKTSMLQDIEAGRKTEVEIFAGKVMALGKQYNVATHVNETVFHIIRALESNR